MLETSTYHSQFTQQMLWKVEPDTCQIRQVNNDLFPRDLHCNKHQSPKVRDVQVPKENLDSNRKCSPFLFMCKFFRVMSQYKTQYTWRKCSL